MDNFKIFQILNVMNLIISGAKIQSNEPYYKIANAALEYIQNQIDESENIQDFQFETSKDDNYLPDFTENQIQNNIKLPKNYEYSDIIKISDYMKKHPNLKFKTIRVKFRKCTQNLFYKIKKLINNGVGFKNMRIVEIKQFLINKFKIHRRKFNRISDNLLKIWAINKAKTMNFERFKASNYFIRNFKKEYGISGRKINKYVNKNQEKSIEQIQNSIQIFRKNFKDNFIDKYQPHFVLNADQTGFKYEMCPKRTLTFRGEKVVFGKIQNKNASTHSYTVMPTISMAGNCFGKYKAGMSKRDQQKIP